MLGFYNYTVILTYLGMLTGFAGIVRVLSDDIRGAIVCLMIAGVCDMFDGTIASTMERTKQEKRFGVQIDSLSDLVCFGVLPALIVYAGGSGGLRFIPCALYLLCALIRLSWFNVDEEERQEKESGHRTAYLDKRGADLPRADGPGAEVSLAASNDRAYRNGVDSGSLPHAVSA